MAASRRPRFGSQAKKGGFYQWRVGDGVGDSAALCIVFTAQYVDADEFGGAFAVAHNRLRQFDRHRSNRVAEFGKGRTAGVVQARYADFARGDEHE
jgi:hypothetical protein